MVVVAVLALVTVHVGWLVTLFSAFVRLLGADPDSLSVSNCRRLVVTLVNWQHTTATTDHNAFLS